MIFEYFQIVFASLKHRKLRSWLTILGITIGITAIVALMSLSQGMEDAFRGIFSGVGSDRIMISPGNAQNPAFTAITVSNLGEEDLEVVKNTKGVYHAIGVMEKTFTVKYRGEPKTIRVVAVPTDKKSTEMIEEVDFYAVEEGRPFEESDKYKAIAGIKIATDTFEKDVKVGDDLEILGHKFEVVGISQESGNPLAERFVRIPLETFKDLTGEEHFFSIFAKTEKGADPNVVVDEIKENLRKERGLKEGEEDFSVKTSNEVIEGAFTILGQIRVFVITIAAVSLVVGGFGVMNTMFTAVTERTKEIGIMKSVGARNFDILAIFTIESGLIGLIGGAIGLLFGYGTAKGVEVIALNYGLKSLKATISLDLVLLSFGISFLLGIVFGLVPAIRAAKLKPVEAIRHG